jgi:hypothetical protein
MVMAQGVGHADRQAPRDEEGDRGPGSPPTSSGCTVMIPSRTLPASAARLIAANGLVAVDFTADCSSMLTYLVLKGENKSGINPKAFMGVGCRPPPEACRGSMGTVVTRVSKKDQGAFLEWV